jgi:predicted flap endonuclease-1-like 5' DNA nuclease
VWTFIRADDVVAKRRQEFVVAKRRQKMIKKSAYRKSSPGPRGRAKAESDLQVIPGVGPSIAADLREIGITKVADLKRADPESLYRKSNEQKGVVQDRCLLYVFRCAVYYASRPVHEPEKLKWWNWKDKT